MEIKRSAIKNNSILILGFLFYLAMVFINFLANYLPINGKNTGQVSAQYPNLFVPAPYTFSIWGVIYLSILVFLIFQLTGSPGLKQNKNTRSSVQNINVVFIFTCVINMTWIVAWHYGLILLSVILMLLLLLLLIVLNSYLVALDPWLSKTEKFFLKAPFGLYLGWICIATIANVTALLVSYGWEGFGLSEESWAFIMILVGAIISIVAIFRFSSIYIGLSVIWALGGIITQRRNNVIYHKYIELCAWIGIAIVGIAIFIELTNGYLWKAGSNDD
ncbi:hypothetical protein [Emticicia fluvialis]|uniref:hypothetical protein n=1 Tax=Emticicia fluvialis TaxID=2974474 RepID=UPI002165191B|nr:hypothetical protein [Emticicia fluvialis]